MIKVKLPAKIPCWKCGGGLHKCETVDGLTIPCDCDNGWRYDFDDLAAAVTAAGYECSFYGSDKGGYKASLANPKAASVHKLIVSVGKGPIPTAALLAAINKVNSA